MIEDLKQVRDALASIAYRPFGGKTEDYLCSARIQTDARETLSAIDRIIADHIPDASKIVVPDGYALVPIECLEYLADKSKFDVTVTSYVDAMLSAAPQPPTKGD